MSNWNKVHCISQTYIIWRHKSRTSKNWANHKNAIIEICKWFLGMKYSLEQTMLALSQAYIKNSKPEFDENSLSYPSFILVCKISHELHPYFTHHSDISYHEGLLLKDQQIIVSSALRSEMKSILHLRHLGIENCKKTAHQALFWPITIKESEDMILKYPTCLT